MESFKKNMDSRASSKIPFLDDTPLEAIHGAKLPTKQMIFLHFWYNFKHLNLTKVNAVRETSKAVINFWEDGGIKPKKIDCIIRDVNKWLHQYEVSHKKNDHSKNKANTSKSLAVVKTKRQNVK